MPWIALGQLTCLLAASDFAPLKLSIGHRLFFTVWLTMLSLGALGIELARWKLLDNFSGGLPDTDTHFLDSLGTSLQAQYQVHHDWSFLPADAAQRKAWLSDAYAHSLETAAVFQAKSDAASVVHRLGLVDRQGNYLAGVLANPMTVALVSPDRIAHPLIVDGERIGSLVVAQPQNPDDALAMAFLIDQQNHLLFVGMAGLLLSAMIAALFAAHLRRPIARLAAGARQLEQARFDTRIDLRRSDELGELASAFNHLAARLEDAERARRQWIAETSHELRTPLAVLRAQVESLQDRVRAVTPESLALMERQVRSLGKLVDDLYELARADIGQTAYDMAPHDAWLLMREVFDDFADRFHAAGLGAEIGEAPAHSLVICDADRLRQVAANLFENSARYTAAGGHVALAGTASAGEVRMTIDDSAPGIPGSSLDRLGERFFRMDASRSRASGGSGLGLALGRQILAAHGGRLEFAPSPLGGLRATIILKLHGA
ncbi:HAMP domain-containing protein [Rhodanobacter sp. 7MK24]|uniref:ATP-binding protein n=1 Tax=Rhodanobacter sp. 7MK24 TaxID=2775922 RepID=UPI001786BFAA|nr:ATP-binding protein [Rhodanobacter sp. 7MK24]MBD8882251.1 HAMP domain-containing protein [Rhodanobacter sp. 7MK24]